MRRIGIVFVLAAFQLWGAPGRQGDLLRKLVSDIGQAVSHAKLADDQSKNLGEARKVISELAAQRRIRDQYDRDDLRQAVKVVKNTFNKNKKLIRAEDRKAVFDDLDQVVKAGLLKAAPARRAPRGPAMPRTPYPRNRYPRRLLLSETPSVS
ncbi:MAG: hypothetical protein HY822_01370 [Acidobacteria bacterium]|nr:hypothetical protein [Acidobacteriota bacterium]